MSRSLLRRIVSLSLASPRPSPAIFVSSRLYLSSSSSSSSFSSSSSSSRFAFSSYTRPSPYAKPSADEESSISPPSANDNDDIPCDVTTEELKQRIARYQEGDVEALPSIFEAILARKLSGKHEDTDDELMEEFRSKTQHDSEHGSLGLDDDDELTDSDEDLFDSDDNDDLSDSDDDDEEFSD